MHYSSTSFSVNGNPTITPRQANAVIGQRFNMSTTDIEEVRLFYRCPTVGEALPNLTTTVAGESLPLDQVFRERHPFLSCFN